MKTEMTKIPSLTEVFDSVRDGGMELLTESNLGYENDKIQYLGTKLKMAS